MDNLGAHKGERVRELIEGRGCKILYLPPYSPDFNSIEEGFRRSRVFCARLVPGQERRWWRPIGKALDTVTKDACGFFVHGGYRTLVQ